MTYKNPDNPHTASTGYDNNGDLTATSTVAGTALKVGTTGFRNYGAVTASGSDSIGIHVEYGGFTNYVRTSVTASGSGSGGIGIHVESGGFTNQGLLNLTGSGTSILIGDHSGNDIRLSPNSLTLVGGGY